MIKKTMIFVSLIPVIIILGIVSLFIVNPIINNMELVRFEKQLTSYPLPRSTIFIESKSTLGKLNGNGNGIDFFSSLLVYSKLPIEELKKHYEIAKFENAKKSGEYPVEIDLIPVTSVNIDSKYLEHDDLRFESLLGLDTYSEYYFVIIYDGGYDAFFDIRGN
jgi:hypothetical protein